MSLILLGILNSQVTAAGGGAYELIESNILTSSASSVTFSSIPQDYKHLQIRVAAKSTNASTGFHPIYGRFNGVSSGVYTSHTLRGTGSSVSSGVTTTSATQINDLMHVPQTYFEGDYHFGVAVMDILDYSNTSKNTTLRSLAGVSAANNYRVQLASGLYMQTTAVTSFQLFPLSGNFAANSRFSLYGVK